MAVRLRQFHLAIGLVLICTVLQGSELSAPGQSETISLLTAHRFAELDQRYGQIQQQYEDGKISDEDLRAAFRAFYSEAAALEPHYEAWVRESPKSYVAHLARGIYYKKLGAARRGGNFIDQTSDEQLAGMEAAYEIADHEFSTSLTLDKKPLLTYLHSIDLRSAVGDTAGARRLLDAAVAIDPKNFIVRLKYMDAIQTRWGGSVAETRGFLRECRAAGLSDAHLKQLEALVVEDEAWVHRYREGDVQAAVRDYRKAAKLNPEASCEPCGPLNQAADALFDAKNYQEAVKAYSKVLRRDPNSIHALNGRGLTELQLNRPKEKIIQHCAKTPNKRSRSSTDHPGTMGTITAEGALAS